MSLCEPFPEGTPVSYPTKLNPSSNTATYIRGLFISVPISNKQNCLPISDKDASPYIIKLVDGSIHQVSPNVIEQFVIFSPSSTKKIRFLTWLGNNQKVMFLHNGLYVKGIMEGVWMKTANFL